MKILILPLFFLISSLLIAQVGISTTTPEATLDVRGASHLGPVQTGDGVLVPRVSNLILPGSENGQLVFLIADNAGNNTGFYYWDETNWIGIANGWRILGNQGTTNGTNFLGTTDAQDLDIRTNNIIKHRFTQKGQLEFLNTGESVYIGEESGENINTDLDPDLDPENTFVGYKTGRANTIGLKNSFFGRAAGQNNTIGNRNNFFGAGSGSKNIDGSNNSFFGSNSGNDNTSGKDNSFFGKDCGTDSTTGEQNVFIGADSGEKNTTGSFNTYIGSSSGLSNTTGSRNVFLGSNAGKNQLGDDFLIIENSTNNLALIGGDFNTNKVSINLDINSIGTGNFTRTLNVNGEIYADTYYSNNETYPDYVFEDYFKGTSKIKEDYKFTNLEDAIAYVKEHGHLINVKSYKDIQKDGNVIDVAATSIKNLEKIEENFLYISELKTQNDTLKEENNLLKEKLNTIEQKLETILNKINN